MFIYNEVISKFVSKQEENLNKILIELKEKGERVSPLKILIHEDPTKLGLYYQGKSLISLDKSLIFKADDMLLNEILRHEIAHHLVYLSYGKNVKGHGKEFQEKCSILNIPANATINIREKMEKSKEKNLLEKVQKLLKLGSSNNSHEAELAILKANEILLNNNLKFEEENKGTVYMVPVLETSQATAKHTAIAQILETFNVFCVWSKVGVVRCPVSGALLKRGQKVLQISGDETSVEIAKWVGEFLNDELDRIWKKESKDKKLKGRTSKNSFFLGIASGYLDKTKVLYNSELKEKSLVIINNVKDLSKKFIYKNGLRSSSSRRKQDKNSFNLGKEKGTSLSFNKPIKSQGDIKLIK